MDSLNRLLIVDDDAAMRDFLSLMAEALGYEVRASGNASDFLHAFSETCPSVILLDLSMPERDGIEVLRDLAERGCKSSIVLTSGQNQRVLMSTQRLGTELGLSMVATLEKPVSERALRAVLSRTWTHAFNPTRADFIEAMEQGQIKVHYQPKVSLADGEGFVVVGAEALARWQHPKHGMVPPSRFVPLAEREGLIGDLTDIVLNHVIEQLVTWIERDIRLAISVNLSPGQLTELDLPDMLVERMTAAGLDPSLLVLEITEQTASPDFTRATDILTRLRLKGFRVSLDDFGAGYSSIAELYRMPLSEVKIDRSIIANAETDKDARKVVKAIVDLAHSFELTVCAEGVESEENAAFLQKVGCDWAQGYYFSEPLPPTHFAHFVSKSLAGDMPAVFMFAKG